MNIGKQIYILLKKNTAVYVKGLGAFKRVHTPATFDAKKNVYLPPVTFIEFDALASDGYDFITYLQQIEQSDRTEAESKVEQAVSYIKEQVVAHGQVMLDSLGQLVGYGDSYVFKPLDLSGFAFSAVEAPSVPETVVSEDLEEKAQQVVETPIAEKNEEHIAENTMAPSVEEDTEAVENTEETVLDEEEGEEVSDTGIKSFVYGLLAALAVLVIAGVYYYSEYYQEVPPRNTTTVLPLQDTVPLVDTTDVLTERDTLVDPIDSLPTEVVETPIDTPVVKHRYAIVIGTHPTLAKAYEEAEAFNKDGHKSVRVITPNLAKNLKRVIWDTYATKEERDSALRYVQKHIKTDAWPTVLP